MNRKLTALNGERLFETERLVARNWRADDVATLFAVYGDEEGARYVGDGLPIKFEECEQWLEVTASNYATRGYGMFALESQAGSVIGFCGIVHPGNQEDAEVKYAFLKSTWGQGLASEMVPALVTYASTRCGLQNLIATVAAGNMPSQRVLEKSGFVFEKVLDDGEGTLCFVWQAVR